MKTVMTFGTFDIVHPGHMHFLQQAKTYGDRLITIVARDVNVKKFKGERPLHLEKERLQDIKNLHIADVVELGHATDYFLAIEKYKPDIIAIGYDQTHLIYDLWEFLYKNKYKTEIVTIEWFEISTCKSSIIKKESL